jgi:hypothetical protein
MASQIRPRLVLFLAAIGLAAMLTGCEAYQPIPYMATGTAPNYGGTYVGIGGGWNDRSWHDHGWRGGGWDGHGWHNHSGGGGGGHNHPAQNHVGHNGGGQGHEHGHNGGRHH